MPPETGIQKIRSERKFFSWTGAFLLAGVILLINFLASYLPIRWDTSQGQVYSLSQGSKQLLKDLDDTMVIRMYFSKDLPPQLKLNERYIRDLLSEYRRASRGAIKVEYIDPSQSARAKQDAVLAGVHPVQLDVIEKDRREIKESFMGLALLYGDKKESISFIQDTQGLEYEITQRVQKLINPKFTKLGFVTNGEALTLASEPLQQLKEPIHQLYETVEVDLSQEIPPDIAALWWVGPTAAIESAQVENLRSWVESGGVLGLLIDRYQIDLQTFRPNPSQLGIDDLLKEWGVDFRRALVVDTQSDRIQIRTSQGFLQMTHIIDYPYFPLVTDFEQTFPATRNLDGVSMPFSSPLIVDTPVEGLTYTSLLKTSRRSWLDTAGFNTSPLQEHRPPENAVFGPFDVGLMVEGSFGTAATDGPIGRVLIFGCSRFVRTDYPPRPTNFTLFFNLMDWSGQEEFLLSVRSKGVSVRLLREVPERLRAPIKYSLGLALPLLSLAAGFVILSMSRKRRARLPGLYREV